MRLPLQLSCAGTTLWSGASESCPEPSALAKRRTTSIRHTTTISIVFGVLLILHPARGDVVAIEPFQGALSENFDNLSAMGAQQQLTIMDGFGTVTNLTTGGALKLELSSSLNGVLVVPRSPPKMLGQLGISAWEFDAPLVRFGSYFATTVASPTHRLTSTTGMER
jgi:hypothetical protein